ncbi:DNA polymerase III subunit delta [Chloroflexota bacterium]
MPCRLALDNIFHLYTLRPEVTMLYTLYGKDDFSRREFLEELKGQLGDPEALQTNTTLLEGRHLTLNQLQEVCDALPFLGERRLVLVEGLLARFEARGNTPSRARSRAKATDPAEAAPKEKDEVRAFATYLKGLPEHTVLVLLDGELNRNGAGRKNPLLSELSSLAKVVKFDPLRGEYLLSWIGKEIERRGGQIKPGAVRLLAETAGENRWTLNNEVEKLLLFASGQTIQEQDVRLVVSAARETTIFMLVDDVLQKRGARAQQRLAQLSKEGIVAPVILVVLAREVRRLILARELIAQRLPAAEVQSRLDIRQDWLFKKETALARKYPAQQLEEVYRRLLEADLAIKTGKNSNEMALTLLVVELTCR